MNRPGVIVPTLLFIMLFFTVVTLSLADYAASQFRETNNSVVDTSTLLTAEAGAEQTLLELNEDNNFNGFGTEIEFFNTAAQGRATYQSTIANGNQSNEKIITSTARSYRYNESSNPQSTRMVRLTVVGTTVSENYAVHSGSGGLSMTGSATIANGPVYLNGSLSMTGSARIGSSAQPVDVYVGNYRCPLTSPYTSYPALCTAAQGQPITNTGSSSIYGNVCATHQTDGTRMFSPGLSSGCVAPFNDLPPHDRSAITSTITSTQTASQASCGGSTSKSWPANLHITSGNVSIGGSCTLTINGNVWIDGNLTINGSGRIIIGGSVASPPHIMVDGANGVVLDGSGRISPNASNIAALVVTYRSTASCSPGCSTVTGTDLKNSESITTVSITGSGQSPGTLFYARWTRANVAGSGSTGGVIAQRVLLSGSGNIVFGTQLSSGQSVWSIRNYQQIFN